MLLKPALLAEYSVWTGAVTVNLSPTILTDKAKVVLLILHFLSNVDMSQEKQVQ
jgi:hypothetical protein